MHPVCGDRALRFFSEKDQPHVTGAPARPGKQAIWAHAAETFAMDERQAYRVQATPLAEFAL